MRFCLSFFTGVIFLLAACWYQAVGAEDATPAEAVPAFIEGFGDVPLLSGFTYNPDQTVIFDTPAGTIAETLLFPIDKTPAPLEKTLKDYQRVLTPLGWQCQIAAALLCAKDQVKLVLKNITPDPNTRQPGNEKKVILHLKIQPQKGAEK